MDTSEAIEKSDTICVDFKEVVRLWVLSGRWKILPGVCSVRSTISSLLIKGKLEKRWNSWALTLDGKGDPNELITWESKMANYAPRNQPNLHNNLKKKKWCWFTWWEELTHWKKTLMLRKRAGEGGDRGWDVWMASSTQWTSVWARPRRQWRTGKPSLLQSMGSQRVRHDLATGQ